MMHLDTVMTVVDDATFVLYPYLVTDAGFTTASPSRSTS
jgi:arginine deiminase